MLSSNMAASIATTINIHLCMPLFTLLRVTVSPWTSPFVIQARDDRVRAWCMWWPWISRSVCAIRQPCWRTAWCQWKCSIVRFTLTTEKKEKMPLLVATCQAGLDTCMLYSVSNEIYNHFSWIHHSRTNIISSKMCKLQNPFSWIHHSIRNIHPSKICKSLYVDNIHQDNSSPCKYSSWWGVFLIDIGLAGSFPSRE